MPEKLTIDEIRKDPELIQLHKDLLEANAKYHNKVMELYRENDIEVEEFKGFGISYSATFSQ